MQQYQMVLSPVNTQLSSLLPVCRDITTPTAQKADQRHHLSTELHRQRLDSHFHRMDSLVPKTCLLILSSIRQILGAGHGGGPLPRHPQVPPGARLSLVAELPPTTIYAVSGRDWSIGAEDSPPSKVTAQSCQTMEFLGQLLERRTEAAPHERQNKVRTTPVELGLIPLMAVGGDVKGSG
ncbi:uncharacterized protein PADG_11149 [Paracoccidioides brasiliensis Pb18]|uniref:Uncharacterized protein n=1 Tax=Paracoccidioides brasiliensis (strain Pb18) TaxID=502780 RepID=A0A0A0HVV9_PARBD|nr:uncharacterized protein PADG_11149 [Paracoccidioides brasiliensis Pb18]KGM92692.1 hypothetical protein PADG_11149 [Paracoccidioides brasiliensis Pb18]